MELKQLPAYDGAMFICTMEMRTKKWPYVKRCKKPATGLLSNEVYAWTIRCWFNSLGGKAVCAEHGKEIMDAYEQDQVED